MSIANPDTLPAYSSIFAGTTNINDIVRATSTSVWARTALKQPVLYSTFFSTQTADFLGSRATTSNWTLDPTIVPEKLRAMRAACRWVTLGRENVGPDILWLTAYQEPTYPDGFYFDVADRLAALPQGWFHCADSWFEIPKDACYWAGCEGKYVWVGPEGMAGLSQFVLIMQRIARIDLGSIYYPKPHTRTIAQNFSFQDPPNTPNRYWATATIYVDAKGHLTTAANTLAIPMKGRIDNIGSNADLKSVINASAKSSSP